MSIVTRTAQTPGDALPAASLAIVVNECAPSARAAVSSVQLPPWAVTLPSAVSPSKTVTLEPGSVVPLSETIGCARSAPSVGVAMAGAAGSCLSTMTTAVFCVVAPSASVAVTCSSCRPSVRSRNANGDVQPRYSMGAVVRKDVHAVVPDGAGGR